MKTSLKFLSIAGAGALALAAAAALTGPRVQPAAPATVLASVSVDGHRADADSQQVVQLEPVTVIGHRSDVVADDVVQLESVTVVGHRADADLQVVQLEPVTVVGHREPTWSALLAHVAQRWHAAWHDAA